MQQAILLLTFSLAIICIIKEPKIRIGKKMFVLDYGSAPLLAVVLLGLFGFIDFSIIRDSLLGNNGVVPWQVILIFFAGAYICITMDSTGIFEYFSFKIINWARGSAKKLFLGVIFVSALLTIFTSNDIVILTMTPILCYAAKHSKMNPIPYLLVMFFSANAWSMFFYVGNPPNIIVAQAFNLSFIEYAKLMFFPTIAAGLSTSILTYLVFRKQLGQKIIIHEIVDPSKYIRNKKLAFLSVFLFFIFFIALASAEYIGFEVWQIMLLFFVIYLFFGLISSFYYAATKYHSHKYHYNKTKSSMIAININFDVTEFRMAFERIPWKMLPLVISLFIMVQLFNVYGITSLLASGLNQLNTIFLGSVLMPFVSALNANIMINQPMTILFANIFNDPNYFIQGKTKLANGLGLVIGTNLGGNLTLFGALAGMMWKKILAYNGIKMSYLEFLRYSLKITPFVILITSLVLYIQMVVFF